MLDRYLTLFFQGAALLLGGVVIVLLLDAFIVWLQSGNWKSVSLLEAAYDAHLLKARWFLNVDWGWRLHEWLQQIPLLAALAVLVPAFWGIGLFFSRR